MTQVIPCQTLTKGWLNLAFARQIQFRQAHFNMSLQFSCLIIWNNGERETYFGKDAHAIAQTIEKFSEQANSSSSKSST